MKTKGAIDERSEGPIVIGAGLIALDVVYTDAAEQKPQVWAGGTCGNVLTILSFLGWRSYPVARLSGDNASRLILEDLKKWQVRLEFAQLAPQASAPVIVQRITRRAGQSPAHHFSWHCPKCGSWLPGYRSVLGKSVEEILPKVTATKVVFLDRVSRGNLNLAKACLEKGALLFFEPSGVGEPRLFEEALSLAHVVKYSHERMGETRFPFPQKGPLLEIETLGASGLRYRSRLKGRKGNEWRNVSSFPVATLRDAAGAGDWCSAGIIHKLGQRGLKGLTHASSVDVEHALQYGQALAAWNCGFEGARGGMYQVSQVEFRSQVAKILKKTPAGVSEREQPSPALKKLLESLCPGCEESSKSSAVRRTETNKGKSERAV